VLHGFFTDVDEKSPSVEGLKGWGLEKFKVAIMEFS
jgi:hypothetical protein